MIYTIIKVAIGSYIANTRLSIAIHRENMILEDQRFQTLHSLRLHERTHQLKYWICLAC